MIFLTIIAAAAVDIKILNYEDFNVSNLLFLVFEIRPGSMGLRALRLFREKESLPKKTCLVFFFYSHASSFNFGK